MLACVIENFLLDMPMEVMRRCNLAGACSCPWLPLSRVCHVVRRAVGGRAARCGCLEWKEHRHLMHQLAWILPHFAHGAITLSPFDSLAVLHEVAILAPPHVMTLEHALHGWYTNEALLAALQEGWERANRCSPHQQQLYSVQRRCPECEPGQGTTTAWGHCSTDLILFVGRTALREKAKFILGRRLDAEPWFHHYYQKFSKDDDDEGAAAVAQ